MVASTKAVAVLAKALHEAFQQGFAAGVAAQHLRELPVSMILAAPAAPAEIMDPRVRDVFVRSARAVLARVVDSGTELTPSSALATLETVASVAAANGVPPMAALAHVEDLARAELARAGKRGGGVRR